MNAHFKLLTGALNNCFDIMSFIGEGAANCVEHPSVTRDLGQNERADRLRIPLIQGLINLCKDRRDGLLCVVQQWPKLVDGLQRFGASAKRRSVSAVSLPGAKLSPRWRFPQLLWGQEPGLESISRSD